MFASGQRIVVERYLTELSLLAKQVCPEAGIENPTLKTNNFLDPVSRLLPMGCI